MNRRVYAVNKVALFLLCAMLFSTIAFATNSRASSRIDRFNVNLYVDSSGELCTNFYVAANGKMDSLGVSKITIQRYNGSRWIVESTLTVRNYPDMQTSNVSQHSAAISYTPAYTGATYRAVVTAYAEDSYGSSTSEATTGQVRT